MRSVPSTTERLSGEASTSMGKHVAGRRFAKRSSSLRNPQEPALRALLLRQVVPLGPAHRPEQDGVAPLAEREGRRRQRVARRVDGRAADQRRLELEARRRPPRPTTSRTCGASGVTSCPMPSPGSTAILWVAIYGLRSRSVRVPGCRSRSTRVSRRAWRRARAGAVPERAGVGPLEQRTRRTGGTGTTAGAWRRSARPAPPAASTPDGPALREVQFLEAVVAEGRDHQEGDHVRAARDRGPPASADVVRAFEEQDGRGHHAGRGRGSAARRSSAGRSTPGRR